MQPKRGAYRETASLVLKLQSLMDPSIQTYVSDLRTKYRKYAMPVEEGRKVVDEAMGSASLTALLYEMRQDRV